MQQTYRPSSKIVIKSGNTFNLLCSYTDENGLPLSLSQSVITAKVKDANKSFVVSLNPAIKFGYGVWEKFAKGRTLVGHTDDVTSNSPDWIKSVGREYGEYEHKLTGAELPKVDNIGDLTLTKHYAGDDTTRSGVLGVADRNYDLNAVRVEGVQLNLKGGDKPHNNVQPSIVVYFWKRVS